MPFLHCFSSGWQLRSFCKYSVPQNCAPIIRKSIEVFCSKSVEGISRLILLLPFEYTCHADIEHRTVTNKSPKTRICSFLLILSRIDLIMKMQIRNSTTRYEAVRAIVEAARGPFDHLFCIMQNLHHLFDIDFIFVRVAGPSDHEVSIFSFRILDKDNNLITGIFKISFCRKRSKNEVFFGCLFT